jgi:hypothetical protein
MRKLAMTSFDILACHLRPKESAQSWRELLGQLKRLGLSAAPKLGFFCTVLLPLPQVVVLVVWPAPVKLSVAAREYKRFEPTNLMIKIGRTTLPPTHSTK